MLGKYLLGTGNVIETIGHPLVVVTADHHVFLSERNINI